MGAIEIAGAILSRASGRVEVSAQNLANMTTPGYKAKRAFLHLIDANLLDQSSGLTGSPQLDLMTDFTRGKARNTGNPFDLAIAGRGFFAVRSGDTVFYTRDGQFSRDADGRLVTPEGMVLQSDGADLIVSTPNPTILGDGTVLDHGEPVARVKLADFADPQSLEPASTGTFSATGAPQDVAAPQIRQGMLEEANVNTADEMLSVMSALRSAEAGQRMVQVYDDLLGRAVTAFGQM